MRGQQPPRFDPPGEGNQWDDQAVSNAAFTGVSLQHRSGQAGVEADAIEVVATGADRRTSSAVCRSRWRCRPEVLLAWEMNGEPIPQPNGGPVRMIVPRWAGIASVKWPMRLEVVDTPFRGYYNAERYIIVDADGRTLRSVREMPGEVGHRLARARATRSAPARTRSSASRGRAMARSSGSR